MRDTEDIRKAFTLCKPQKLMRMCGFCPYNDEPNCDVALYNDVLSLLKEHEAERLEFIETVAKLTAENVTLKEQESRILDWDELEDWNNAVWFEGKDEQDCYIALTANVGTYDATIVNVEPGKCYRLAYLHEFYKKEWRCWSAEPTAKQRKAVKWR